MSRSIHTTRSELARLGRDDYADPEQKRERAAGLRRELGRKRALKRQAADERRGKQAGHAPTPVEEIPVRAVGGEGPYVHHPASPEDVREVLRLLPRGVTDGLAGVELRLGAEVQEEHARSWEVPPRRDPFTGRVGDPHLPGVWLGPVRGRYRGRAGTIELYAAVFDPGHRRRGVWGVLLRLHALSVLAHEVAHHHDVTSRQRRGRWVARPGDGAERYAQAMQHAWTHEVVLPYLRRRHGAEVQRLERWVRRHGGIALPLEALADDPRTTMRGGYVHAERLFFAPSSALSRLLEDVEARRPPRERRLNFARELHYGERYEDALRVLETVFREHPDDAEARVLRGDVLVHQERFAEALEIARGVLAGEPERAEAWEVAADALEGLERWDEAAEAAGWLVRWWEGTDDRWKRCTALAQRGRARLRGGDREGAREDAERLRAAGGRGAERMAKRLLAEVEEAERERGAG